MIARAAGWNYATFALGKGMVVVSTIVLARLLVPSDFGLVALGLLVINYLDRLKDLGVGAGLVQRREEWDRLAGSGFLISALTSVVLAAAAFLLAPTLAEFFGEPRLTGVIRALAAVVLISGLSVTPEARLRRELDFRRRSIPELTGALVKGGLSIGLAVAGLGVWSLVWGQLGGTLLTAALYWTVAGWRPTVSIDRQAARALLRYGIPMTAVGLLAVVLDNLDYLFIGRRQEAAQLGYYTLGFRIPELVVIGLCIVVGQVLFAAFSRLQDDREQMRESYLRAARYVAVLTTPAAAGLALAAPEVVTVLYSSGWEPAVPVLRLLSLYALVYALSFHAGEVYKAIGRPGILNTLGVARLAVSAPVLWIAAGRSIAAVALATLVLGVAFTALRLVVAGRILHIPLHRYASAFAPAFMATALMSPAVLGVDLLLAGAPEAARLPALAVTGVLAYAAALRLVTPAVFAQLRSALGPPREGSPSRQPAGRR